MHRAGHSALIWKNRDTVVSDTGVPIQPTLTYAETPEDLEILFVPGGTMGTVAEVSPRYRSYSTRGG